MDKRQKKKLTELTDRLVEAIKGAPFDSLLNHLLSNSMITTDMLEYIMANLTPTKQARELHILMMNRGPGAFEGYYKALMESDDPAMMDVARRMEDCLDPKYARPLPRDNLDAGRVSPINGPPQMPEDWPPTPYEPENMTMTECSVTDAQVKQQLLDNGVYPLPHGQAIIINNKTFGSEPRIGTDVDCETMEDTLEEMGFRVRVFKDRTKQEILDDIENSAKERRSVKCFVCVILSHGKNGSMSGVDYELVTLTEMLSAAQTKPGVPTVFIIQACQGRCEMGQQEDSNQPETDHNVRAGSGGDASGPERTQLYTDTGDDIVDAMTKDLDSLSDKDFHSHRFVAMATVPGYVAYRSEKKGSWFIQALVYALKKWAYCDDICGIFTKVNALVGRRSYERCKQVSISRSTLEKKLYFFPGIKDGDVTQLQQDGNS